MTETTEMKVNGWSFNVMPKILTIRSEEVEKLERGIIKPWSSHYFWENTWVQKELNIPSILIRLDMAFHSDGSIGVYEVEERPSGMGVTMKISPAFAGAFKAIYGVWERTYGNLEFVVSSRREKGDDELVGELMGVKVWKGLPTISDNSLYFVRADPDEKDYYQLGARSVTTIVSKGDKSYGVSLNLWRPIPDSSENLPWDKGFALKPRQGSKLKDVYLWHPSKFKGTHSKNQLLRAIQEKRVHYFQSWISPETHEFLPQDYFLIRRIYWGWDPIVKKWFCLGGIWNARPNTRVHGAPDALFGEVIILP